eukprot:COSAG02_NODE_2286_length_9213_cov_149.155914_11_plen_392_part_00
MFLALPWCALRLVAMFHRCTAHGPHASAVEAIGSRNLPEQSQNNQVDFSRREVLVFFALAVGTNYAYIVALDFIPASLNTAVFSICPVVSLALSVQFLDATVPVPRAMWVSATISVVGIALISQPWADIAADDPVAVEAHDLLSSNNTDQFIPTTSTAMARSRPLGCALSLAAAVGSACYQVYFKKLITVATQTNSSDGDSDEVSHNSRLAIGPVESGLLLSRLGLLVFVVVGSALSALIYSQTYELNLGRLPYPLLAATAGLSLLFNFATTFGLSISSPMVVSIATQLGIPLNLMIDVFFEPTGSVEAIDSLAICGVALMLVSFTLPVAADYIQKTAPDRNKLPFQLTQIEEQEQKECSQEKHVLLSVGAQTSSARILPNQSLELEMPFE